MNKRYKLIPERCSIVLNGMGCKIHPSFLLSIRSKNEEYLIGVVCDEHVVLMKKKIMELLNNKNIPNDCVNIQEIKSVVTECVLNPSHSLLNSRNDM